MELWKAYGTKSDYRQAPRLEALKVRLILQKRRELDRQEQEALRKQQEAQAAQWRAMTGQ